VLIARTKNVISEIVDSLTLKRQWMRPNRKLTGHGTGTRDCRRRGGGLSVVGRLEVRLVSDTRRSVGRLSVGRRSSVGRHRGSRKIVTATAAAVFDGRPAVEKKKIQTEREHGKSENRRAVGRRDVAENGTLTGIRAPRGRARSNDYIKTYGYFNVSFSKRTINIKILYRRRLSNR